jgi:putative ABC transport system permease protein
MAAGAKTWSISFQFIIEALTLSVIGGVAGIILGVSGSKILASAAGWPMVVCLVSIFLAFGFSGLVGIFSGFTPLQTKPRFFTPQMRRDTSGGEEAS